MLDGRFSWATTGELAKLWGCDASTVRGYAAEAVRAFRREVDRFGRQEFRARLVAQMAFIGRDALERTEDVVDALGNVHSVHRPDHRTARQALVDIANLEGLLVNRHEVALSELSDEEIRAQLRVHGLEVRVLPITTEPAEPGEGDGHDGAARALLGSPAGG